MNFVYPNFLWALGLLAIPVIIHLFNFRRYKTVYFSKVDLLNEAIEDSKSGNKLKHLLIMFTRMLAIAALVLAFAQPFIATQSGQNTKTTSSIYIDNSFSMEAKGQDGNLLNEIKNKAIDLVNSFDENEKINLLTSDLLSMDQRFYTKADILERIKQIDLSPAATPLKTATNLQIDLLNKTNGNLNKRLFILSDFQISTTTLNRLTDTTIQPFIYKAKPEILGNVYIDSVWFESPVQSLNAPIELFFRIKNESDRSLENLTLTLKVNGKEKGIKSLKVGAESYVEEKISYSHVKAGIKTGEISIKTSQLFFDDSFFFTYQIKSQTNILVVNGAGNNNRSFEQLFNVNSFYNCTTANIDQLKQEDFKNKAFIIFNGVKKLTSGAVNLLNEALVSGASTALIPGEGADINSWNQFLQSKKLPLLSTLRASTTNLKYFNDSDPLYRGVFDKKPEKYRKTTVYQYYPLKTNSGQNFISLFGISNNQPFLTYSQTGNGGKIVLQAAPLLENYTDFDKQALFAATYLRLAETAAYEKTLYYTIGEPSTYNLHTKINEKLPIHLTNELYQIDIIPSTSITKSSQKIVFDQLDGVLNQSGFYTLTNLKDFEDKVAFNFNRLESSTKCLEDEELLNLFEENQWHNTNFLTLNQKGQIEINHIKPKEYWRLLLFLALLFLLIEIALLKLWKTN